jgi:hypothetical protein
MKPEPFVDLKKAEEKLMPEKEVPYWGDDFSLSAGSCCDEGDSLVEPVECSLK